MSRKLSLIIVLTAVLTGMLTLASNIQPTKASGTIHIRADGSIYPETAPIQRNGDLYTLTGNIITDADGIVIERNNMTLDGAGYMLQGRLGSGGRGISLAGRKNVTIWNMEIKLFYFGIQISDYSSDNNIVGNNITENNQYGIRLAESSSNSIYHNNFISNAEQVLSSTSTNVWDDGYPSGGNYWSDYNGTDLLSGPCPSQCLVLYANQ